MRHGMKRQDPKGVGEKLKAERAARGVPELPENAEYEAERAKLLTTKNERQRAQAQKRKRDAELKQRGIDPACHVSPEMLDLDEKASKELGVPSIREQHAARWDERSADGPSAKK
jgi:aconitase B